MEAAWAVWRRQQHLFMLLFDVHTVLQLLACTDAGNTAEYELGCPSNGGRSQL
jgi:hypothetical protein